MTEAIQSPLTADEKSALMINTRSSVRLEIMKALIWAFFMIAALGFAILYSLWKWLSPVENPEEYQGAFIILSGILSAMALLKMCWKDIKGMIKGTPDLIARDLKNGMANTLKISVQRAVEIQEYEDEGTGFFLELPENRVLCVIGQDLYEYASDAELEEGQTDKRHLFPQTEIEIRFAPQSRWRLGLKGVGESLRPFGRVKTTRRFYKKDKSSSKGIYTVPEDNTFYNGSLEDVLNQFGYKLEAL